jgi:phosphotransferase system HPr (HPr) family protein
LRTLQIPVTDVVGLHARPAALFVKCCGRFQASIRIRNLTEGSKWVNAKSILSLLTAGVKQNDVIEIEADGEDDQAAIDALQTLIQSDFSVEA